MGGTEDRPTRGSAGNTLERLGLARLRGQSWQYWLAAGGLGFVALGCMAPWSGGELSAFVYGFQGDDGKAFLLVALAAAWLLWGFAQSGAPGRLLLVAGIGFFLMVSAGLEIESIDAANDQRTTLFTDFGGGDGEDLSGAPSILESWGLFLVLVGALATAIGAGLLAHERAVLDDTSD